MDEKLALGFAKQYVRQLARRETEANIKVKSILHDFSLRLAATFNRVPTPYAKETILRVRKNFEARSHVLGVHTHKISSALTASGFTAQGFLAGNTCVDRGYGKESLTEDNVLIYKRTCNLVTRGTFVTYASSPGLTLNVHLLKRFIQREDDFTYAKFHEAGRKCVTLFDLMFETFTNIYEPDRALIEGIALPFGDGLILGSITTMKISKPTTNIIRYKAVLQDENIRLFSHTTAWDPLYVIVRDDDATAYASPILPGLMFDFRTYISKKDMYPEQYEYWHEMTEWLAKNRETILKMYLDYYVSFALLQTSFHEHGMKLGKRSAEVDIDGHVKQSFLDIIDRAKEKGAMKLDPTSYRNQFIMTHS